MDEGGRDAGFDGPPRLPTPANLGSVPAEVWEALTSVAVERKALIPDYPCLTRLDEDDSQGHCRALAQSITRHPAEESD